MGSTTILDENLGTLATKQEVIDLKESIDHLINRTHVTEKHCCSFALERWLYALGLFVSVSTNLIVIYLLNKLV